MRDRVAAFLTHRRGEEEEVVQGELERSRAELVAARDAGDEETVSDIRDEWRSRLRRTLRNDPQAVVALRSLLDELAPAPRTATGGVVNNTVAGGVHHGMVIQAHTAGDLTVGDSRR